MHISRVYYRRRDVCDLPDGTKPAAWKRLCVDLSRGCVMAGEKFRKCGYGCSVVTIDQFGRIYKRGVTLIEAVLYISVALGLIVGGLVFYQQASLASQYQAAVRLLNTVTAEARSIYASAGSSWFLQFPVGSGPGPEAETLPRVMCARGAVPDAICRPSGTTTLLQMPWDGTLRIRQSLWFFDQSQISVTYSLDPLPPSICARLAVTTGKRASFAENVEQIRFFGRIPGGGRLDTDWRLNPDLAPGVLDVRGTWTGVNSCLLYTSPSPRD